MQSNWTRKSGLWVTDFDDANFSNTFSTTLKTAMNNSVLIVETDSVDLNGDGFPFTTEGGGQIVIDEGGGNEEYINYSSHDGMGGILTVPAGGRGQNSTSAVSHLVGETVALRNKVLIMDGSGEIERNDAASLLWKDVHVECTGEKTTSDFQGFSFFIRKIDSDNFYEGRIKWNGAPSFIRPSDTLIRKVVGGVGTTLATLSSGQTISNPATLFMTAKGTRLDMGIEGVFSFGVVDPDLVAGTISIGMNIAGVFLANKLTIGVPV